MHILSVFLLENLNKNEEVEDSLDNPYMSQYLT